MVIACVANREFHIVDKSECNANASRWEEKELFMWRQPVKIHSYLLQLTSVKCPDLPGRKKGHPTP